MKFLKILAVLLMICFAGIQLIPTTLNQNNLVSKNDFLLVNNTPKKINKLLNKACYDCHSNNTVYPWYNNIQPFTWLINKHIVEGKKELNFSQWNELSQRRKVSKLRSIVKQIEQNKMPLNSYTILHKDSNLTSEDKKLIIDYLNEMKKK